MSTSEARTIHERTVSYAHALLQHGCGAPELEPTHLSQDEREQRDMHHDLLTRARRGVPLKNGLCQGRLLFNFDHKGVAFIWYVFATSLSSPVVVFTIFCRLGMVSCEHDNSINNRCHFLDYAPSKGALDCDYLEALFYQDTDGILALKA